MKINYDEIITKANERKEQLQALTTKLQDIEAQAVKLGEALQYFSELKSARDALDAEGQKLLPPSLSSRLYHVGERASSFWRQMCLSADEDSISLHGLVNTVKEHS